MEGTSDFFHNSVCHTCKKLCDYPAKHCGNCKIVAYCCREHQIQDWKYHKVFCNIALSGHKEVPNNIKTHADLPHFIKLKGVYLHINLGRKLNKAETQMFMFPRLCAICFKQEALRGCSCTSCLGKFSIFDCESCRSEFYCSLAHQEEHQPFHKHWCEKLRLSVDLELAIYQKPNELDGISIKKFTSMTQKLDNITSVLDIVIDTNKHEFLNFSDQILGGLTILASLEQTCLMMNHIIFKPSLNLHLVGASNFEASLNWNLIVEVYFHWICNLKKLNINLIGPELKVSEQFKELKSFLCQECCRTRDIIGPNFYRNFYHEVTNHMLKPDLVVAFNSGLHEFDDSGSDTWKNSLNYLVKFNKVPLVLTSYTKEEIFKDIEVLKGSANIEIIYGPCRNKFKNVKPLRDWENHNVPIYYINNYVCVVVKI